MKKNLHYCRYFTKCIFLSFYPLSCSRHRSLLRQRHPRRPPVPSTNLPAERSTLGGILSSPPPSTSLPPKPRRFEPLLSGHRPTRPPSLRGGGWKVYSRREREGGFPVLFLLPLPLQPASLFLFLLITGRSFVCDSPPPRSETPAPVSPSRPASRTLYPSLNFDK